MDATLTTVPPDGLESVCERLISNGALQNPDKKPRWKCLPHSPGASQSDNSGVFKVIERIVSAVNGSHSKRYASGLQLKVAEESISLGYRHDLSHPDGFFFLGKHQRESSKVNWSNIIMPMECDSTGEEWEKIHSHAKVIWSMHHVMLSDARRRFAHGLTCEHTKARLWYHDRSDVVASEEFDINKDWKHLIRIVVSMLLAPPDRLGFDPDVELLPRDSPNAEPNYDITIRNSDTGEATTYRTLNIISNNGVDRRAGPGTRVWIVRKLVDGKLVGPSYVLKDAWVDQDRVMEHVLLKRIREAQPSYAQYFLTPIDYGLAYFSVAAPDNTHKTLRRMELIPTNHALLAHSNTPHRMSRVAVSPRDTEDLDWLQEGDCDFRYLSEYPLQHYRIVFKEIGKPVHDLDDWTDVFTAIQGGWEGLHAINLCGYVHRDVSSGNILLVPASGSLGQRGVIMDLEYAKEIDDTSLPHDPKTGTTAFMAGEVAFVKHYRLQDIRLAYPYQKPSLRPKPKPLPPFRHNPLHDMESVWWLCMWMIAYLAPAEQNTQRPSLDICRVFYDRCRKREFSSDATEFRERTEHLREVSSLVSLMKAWFTELNDHYRSSYAKYDTSNTCLKYIRIKHNTIDASYKQGRGFLRQLKEASRSLPITSVSVRGASNAGSSRTTTPQPANGPSVKAIKRPIYHSSRQSAKRRKGGSMKTTQSPTRKAGPARKTIHQRKLGASAPQGTKKLKDKPTVETTLHRLLVFVELPIPKQTK
ncbi:hypothetical protein ACGC1H_003423 [Rhizoctonia solani]